MIENQKNHLAFETLVKEDDMTAETYCKVNGIQNPCNHCIFVHITVVCYPCSKEVAF